MEAWPFGDHLQAPDFLRDWAEEHATPPPAAGSPTEAAPDARSEDQQDQQQQHEEDVAFLEGLYPDMASWERMGEEHATPPAAAGSPTEAGGARSKDQQQQQQQHEEDVAFWERMFADMARGDGWFCFGGDGWFRFGGGGADDEDVYTDSTAPMEDVVLQLPWGQGNFYTVDDVEGGDDTAAAGGPVADVAPPIDLELRL